MGITKNSRFLRYDVVESSEQADRGENDVWCSTVFSPWADFVEYLLR